MEHTYAMIKPGYENLWGKIIDRIIEEGLSISQMRTISFTESLAKQFYQEHVDKEFYPSLESYITSGLVLAFDLCGENAVTKWREIIGPTQKEVAVEKAPNSLRALYARSTTENLCHGSDSQESANREISLIFSYTEEHRKEADLSEELIQELKELENLSEQKPDVMFKDEYLQSTVLPLVLEGLSWIMKERPSDPVEHMAMFLLQNRGKK